MPDVEGSMFQTIQWVNNPPGASGSSRIRTRLLAPEGTSVDLERRIHVIPLAGELGWNVSAGAEGGAADLECCRCRGAQGGSGQNGDRRDQKRPRAHQERSASAKRITSVCDERRATNGTSKFPGRSGIAHHEWECGRVTRKKGGRVNPSAPLKGKTRPYFLPARV